MLSLQAKLKAREMSFHQRFLKSKNLHFLTESNVSVEPEKFLKDGTFNTYDVCVESIQVQHQPWGRLRSNFLKMH